MTTHAEDSSSTRDVSGLLRTFLAVILFAASAEAALPQTPLLLGAEDAAGPWGRPDGTGCANDLVKAAYEAVGVEVRLVVLPYARAKAMTVSGQIAGCFAISPHASIAGTIVLAKEPLYSVVPTFYQSLSRPLGVDSASQLPDGTVVSLVRGYEYPPGVGDLWIRGVKFDVGPSEAVNLRKLVKGRVDAVVAMLDALKNEEHLLAEAGVQGKVGRAFQVPGCGSHVGFSVKNPRGAYAKEKFEAGFSVIRANGTYDRIVVKWGLSR